MSLYFRARKQGALVFRLEVENRQRRLDLVQIALITPRGEVRAHKRNTPTADEAAEIAAWIAARSPTPPTGPAAVVLELNLLAGWLAKEASEADLRACADPLLMAMHDLRAVIVRRLSGLADPGADQGAEAGDDD